MSKPAPDRAPRAYPWLAVWALGVTQIVSWGSLYYAFPLLLGPIERQLGWARSEVVGAFSLSVLVAGVAALPVGISIDRFGGRALMSWGSLAAALLLALLSRTESLAAFYLIWIGLGACMAATLYEPAFAVIYRSFGEDARKGITALTLVAGFASTVFWPFTEWLVASLGWRSALIVLGAFNLLVCWPLHRFALPPTAPAVRSVPEPPSGADRNAAIPWRAASFWLLGFVFAANMLAFAVLSVHLIPLLVERGMTSARAAGLAAIIGPMQVAGRVVEYLFGRRVSASAAGLTALAVLPAGLLLLIAGGRSWVAVAVGLALYGASNGVMTVVRAIIPAELFGRERYATLNGALSVPVIATRAAGPLAASIAWSAAGGYTGILWALVLVSALAVVAFYLAARR
jgi:predicted MFS family arabinose efflux permease